MVKLGAVNRSILRYVRFAATTLGGELVGLSRLELPTSPLSGVRSNHLSYKPVEVFSARYFLSDNLCGHCAGRYLQVRR